MSSLTKKSSFSLSKKMKRNCVILASILCLGLIGGLAFKVYAGRPVEIPLENFFQVEFSGEEGLGEGQIVFQKEAFKKNYLGKIKRIGKRGKRSRGIVGAAFSLFVKEAEKEMVLEELEYALMGTPELSKESQLENGEHVLLSCKEDLSWLEKNYNVKLLWEDRDLVVKGLYQSIPVNPFDYLSVQFSGISPDMRVDLELKNPPEWLELSDVHISKVEGLAVGDKIQISFYPEMIKQVQEDHIVFLEKEKEYEVPQSDSYWTGGRDISGETLSILQESFMDSLRREMQSGMNSDYIDLSTLSVQYMGNYFLSRKAEVPGLGHNKLFLIFEVHAFLKLGDGTIRPIQYCNAIQYQDLCMDKDGKSLVKADDGINMGVIHPLSVPLTEGDSLLLYGYENYGEFYKQEIFPLLSDFRGEDNSLKMPISLSENSLEHSLEPSLEQTKQSEESTVMKSEKESKREESKREESSESPETEEGNMG